MSRTPNIDAIGEQLTAVQTADRFEPVESAKVAPDENALLRRALQDAEAGLVFAGADVEPAGDFVPTPTLALRAVRAALAAEPVKPQEPAAMPPGFDRASLMDLADWLAEHDKTINPTPPRAGTMTSLAYAEAFIRAALALKPQPVLSMKRAERESLSPEAIEALRSAVIGGPGSPKPAGWRIGLNDPEHPNAPVKSPQEKHGELRRLSERLLDLHSKTANSYGEEALWDAAAALRRAATQAETAPALEFAEYMANGAERLLDALEAEDGSDAHTSSVTLRSDIYEFRKRLQKIVDAALAVRPHGEPPDEQLQAAFERSSGGPYFRCKTCGMTEPRTCLAEHFKKCNAIAVPGTNQTTSGE